MKLTIHDAEHWITVHPNGREEKGEPLLIEGSNGHYVVKGGAGGKLNGKVVNPTSMSKGKESGGTETPAETPKEEPKTPENKTPEVKEPLSNEQHFENLRKLGEQEAKGGYQGALNDNPAIEEYAQKHDLKGFQLVQGFNEFKQEFEKHAKPKEVGEYQHTPNPRAGSYKVEKESNQFREWGKVNHEVNGTPASTEFNEFELKKGAGETFVEFLNQHGHQLSNRISTSQANSDKPDAFKNDLIKQLYNQIWRNGDPSLPQESAAQTQAMTQAKAQLERIEQAEKKAKEAKSEKYRQAYEKFNEVFEKQKAEQAKVTKRVPYKPAKTAKEAAQFAIQNNLADHANYGSMTVEIANAANESLQRHLEEFPALRESQRFAGSEYEWNAHQKEVSKHKAAIRMAENGWSESDIQSYVSKIRANRAVKCWAWAQKGTGVAFSDAWAKNDKAEALDKALKRSVSSGYHPIGCDTVKSIYDHEYGHQMDYLLDLRGNPQLRNIISQARKLEGGIKANLSVYALENAAEFIAEAWSESINNPNPRPIAKQVAELIRSEYAKKFG